MLPVLLLGISRTRLLAIFKFPTNLSTAIPQLIISPPVTVLLTQRLLIATPCRTVGFSRASIISKQCYSSCVKNIYSTSSLFFTKISLWSHFRKSHIVTLITSISTLIHRSYPIWFRSSPYSTFQRHCCRFSESADRHIFILCAFLVF